MTIPWFDRRTGARSGRCPGQRRGLTLIEVLVAVAMLMALTTVMFSFFYNLLESRAQVIEFTGKQRTAGMLIERLESDLVTTLAGSIRHGPGVRGDEHELRMLSRGVAAHRAEYGPDDPGVLGDLQLVEYRYDPADRTLMGRRRAIFDDDGDEGDEWRSGQGVMTADESFDDADVPDAYSDIDGEDMDAESWFEPIGRDLGRVRFRYYDGNGWRQSFDSLEAGRLPVAIEVTIWFNPWPGEEGVDNLRDEGSQLPERQTFEAEPVFDEQQYLREQEFADRPEPVPDRRRVIVIPDARPADESMGGRGETLDAMPGVNGGGP